ncbi:hypothetical protein OS128_09215 [Corynebacterium sp. P5848]|uniref:hypothetical protein n=1 Tax=Corynebacterium marambiense TaxID=2765364 RepID=UPI002260EB1B|nr:hypothetical protein [Corynebacterium marambiense]MCX7543095.1 hypothetical protein [Corynebacterium marambiense]
MRKKIAIEYNAFDAEKQRGVGPWIERANARPALSLDVQNCMSGLVTSAFEHLHPFPTPDGASAIYGNGIAGMPVTPKATRPGTRDHADAQRVRENNGD